VGQTWEEEQTARRESNEKAMSKIWKDLRKYEYKI
jgi:hypothetical protein